MGSNFYGWYNTPGYILSPSGLETAESCVQGAVPADAVWVSMRKMNITTFPNKLFKTATALKGIDLDYNGLKGAGFSCDSFFANTSLNDCNIDLNIVYRK
jgi:hypothetical protein